MSRSRKISAIIPVYNEEDNILDCINSVQWADEILVADSFSTDKTLEIVKNIPKTRIIQREYKYSTSQKNWAIPQAKYDWILIVDADERVPKELSKEIKNAVNSNGHQDLIVAFRIRRNNYFLGKKIRYSGWQNDNVIRLFKKENARYEDKYVHGKLIVDGKTGELKNRLEHYTIKTINEYLNKIEKYTTWHAMEKNKKRKKSNIIIILFRSAFKFIRDYIFRFGFLDGTYGFILCGLSAFSEFIKYSKLWNLRKGGYFNES
ncbi:MAG: glycosyltransferase family 2 protein [Elusimicrobiota bacterium]